MHSDFLVSRENKLTRLGQESLVSSRHLCQTFLVKKLNPLLQIWTFSTNYGPTLWLKTTAFKN